MTLWLWKNSKIATSRDVMASPASPSSSSTSLDPSFIVNMMEDNGPAGEKIEEAAEAVEDEHAMIDGSPSGDWVLTDSQYAQVCNKPPTPRNMSMYVIE